MIQRSIIKINASHYLSLFVVIAAMLNFLAGINIDMYAPSMPALANYFHVNVASIKTTIAMSIFGWSAGCIVFGALIDSLGRKPIITFGLIFYAIASIAAIDSHSFIEFCSIRFIQGFMVSTVTIGCRALIIDQVTGNRYAIAMLYASLAYSCGAVFGPFLGGFLQYHFGWQENFIAFGCVGLFLFLGILLFINESLPQKQSLALSSIVQNYFSVLKNKQFVAGIFVVTISNIGLMLYPTIGPFIVENKMGYSSQTYGETALLVSAGYLGGALLCRYLLRFLSSEKIYHAAFFVLLLTVILSWSFFYFCHLTLITLLLPIILLNVTVGFITPTMIGSNLKLMQHIADTAMALQVSIWAFLTAVGIYIISHAHIGDLLHLAVLYLILILMQCVVYFLWYKKC